MTQPFISLGVWEIIATLLNTFILYVILKKLFFQKVADMIAAREKEVAQIYTDAEKARLQAEAMEKEYTVKLSEAKSEASEIVKHATQKAGQRSEELLHQAHEQAGHIVKKAEASAEMEMKKAKNQLKDEIGGIALQIAGKVLEKEIRPEDHASLIEKFLAEEGEPA